MRIDARHLVVAALVGCGIDAVGTFAPGEAPAREDAGLPDGSPPIEAGGDAAEAGDAGPDAKLPPALFYVTNETLLYSYAPLTKTWTFLADIGAACPDIDEIAVNDKGQIYGTSDSLETLYEIDPVTHACAKVGENAPVQPWTYALSFVAKTAVDAGEDMLVGYDGRDYIRIALDASASFVSLGALSLGMAPSGDVVSMGNRAFVSVRDDATCSTTDCLVEINPATGTIVKNWGNFPNDEVYALAHWAGKIYGFRSSGEVYEVTLGEPLGIVTLPGPDGGTGFTGAGSSTVAPTQ